MAFQNRIFLATLLVWLSVGMNARTIHWITFIDTNDDHIGEMNKNAHDVLYNHFINVVNDEVAQFGYVHKIYDYSGNKYTPENCEHIIQNLQCEHNDIVVFYYIGHGYQGSTDFQNSKYINCIIGSKTENSIPLSWIHQALKQKKAQFVLTVGVGSNVPAKYSSNPSPEEVVLPIVSNVGGTQTTVANAFLGFKGDIIICSSSPGQDSVGGPTNLGAMDFFTYAFVTCFEQSNMANRMEWNTFLQDVSMNTMKIAKTSPLATSQMPVYDCNLIPFQIKKNATGH